MKERKEVLRKQALNSQSARYLSAHLLPGVEEKPEDEAAFDEIEELGDLLD